MGIMGGGGMIFHHRMWPIYFHKKKRGERVYNRGPALSFGYFQPQIYP